MVLLFAASLAGFGSAVLRTIVPISTPSADAALRLLPWIRIDLSINARSYRRISVFRSYVAEAGPMLGGAPSIP